MHLHRAGDAGEPHQDFRTGATDAAESDDAESESDRETVGGNEPSSDDADDDERENSSVSAEPSGRRAAAADGGGGGGGGYPEQSEGKAAGRSVSVASPDSCSCFDGSADGASRSSSAECSRSPSSDAENETRSAPPAATSGRGYVAVEPPSPEIGVGSRGSLVSARPEDCSSSYRRSVTTTFFGF